MALNLPIVNGSSGVWGTMLNTALTDLDGRTITAKDKNDTQDTDITTLKERVTTLENKPAAAGGLLLVTSGSRPSAVVGQICLETDTGYLYYVQNAGGVPTRLPWPGSYIAKIKQNSAQNLSQSVSTGITMDTKIFDRLGGWNGTSRYTCQVRGTYEFAGGVSFAYNITGYRAVMWAVDGAISDFTRATVDACAATSNTPTSLTARTSIFTLNPGQTVELYGYQNGASPLATDITAPNQSVMTVKYMGYYGT